MRGEPSAKSRGYSRFASKPSNSPTCAGIPARSLTTVCPTQFLFISSAGPIVAGRGSATFAHGFLRVPLCRANPGRRDRHVDSVASCYSRILSSVGVWFLFSWLWFLLFNGSRTPRRVAFHPVGQGGFDELKDAVCRWAHGVPCMAIVRRLGLGRKYPIFTGVRQNCARSSCRRSLCIACLVATFGFRSGWEPDSEGP